MPDMEVQLLIVIITVDHDSNCLFPGETSVGNAFELAVDLYEGALHQSVILLMDTDHLPMEVDQIVVLMSPGVGPSGIRIGPACDTRFISVVDGRRTRPGHLEYHRLPEDAFVHVLICGFRSEGMDPADPSVGTCQESGMVMV